MDELEGLLSDRDTLMKGLESEIGKLKAEKEVVSSSLFLFRSSPDFVVRRPAFVTDAFWAFSSGLGWM